MEAAQSSKTLAYCHISTRRHNPQDYNFSMCVVQNAYFCKADYSNDKRLIWLASPPGSELFGYNSHQRWQNFSLNPKKLMNT